MHIGMIGLGRMGGNMAKRLIAGGHQVVGYDMSPESGRDVDSLEALGAALDAPRIVWGMVPAGKPTDDTIDRLGELLGPGDMVVDGGNTKYADDARHAAQLAELGIHFMDCGVSGGVWGIERGYALMVGGSAEDFERMRPIYETLKPEGENGLVLAGPIGGGHFAKMVHNGIEYGMMQAFGEGFATMVRSDLVADPAAVMTSWKSGSVVGSWLLDLLADAFTTDPTLHNMPPVANESGEAKWMGGGRARARRADAGHRRCPLRAPDLARRRRRHPACRVHDARAVRRACDQGVIVGPVIGLIGTVHASCRCASVKQRCFRTFNMAIKAMDNRFHYLASHRQIAVMQHGTPS